jgi:DNA-binding GntR family transcriptional regulator
MKAIRSVPRLTDQVYEAVLDDICDDLLPAGSHLVQEQIAERLGVSRQPVQQAMALLKADGIVEERGRRGLFVARLDLQSMRHRYEIRAVLDGLAARGAARRARGDGDAASEIERRGQSILAAADAAIETGQTSKQVRCDQAFHKLLYEVSGNPFLVSSAEPHWRFLIRVMHDVLRFAESPRTIWRQHGEILDAVIAGNEDLAERLATEHVGVAAARLEANIGAIERAGKETEPVSGGPN